MAPRRKNNRKRKITRKPQRKKTSMMRQPYVETKYKESEGNYSLINGNSTHVPNCFEFMSQGDLRSQINGRWIFSKWLTQKILVDFSPCMNIAVPITYNLIYGWLKVNLNPLPSATNADGS